MLARVLQARDRGLTMVFTRTKRTAAKVAEELTERGFAAAAVLKPQPEVHVRADQQTQYQYVGRVIVDAQRKGIMKVAFITEPGGAGSK